MEQRALIRINRIKEIFEEIFQAKYGISLKDSNIGRIILKTDTFTRGMSDEDYPLCYVTFNDEYSVRITLYKNLSPMAEMHIKDKGDKIDYNGEELKKEIANILKVDEIGDIFTYSLDDEYRKIIIWEVDFILNRDELENFDIDKQFRDVEKRIKLYEERVIKDEDEQETEK